MGKPVNLNRFRKQKARADDTARANQNAVVHGLTKEERDLAKAKENQRQRLLDVKQRDPKK